MEPLNKDNLNQPSVEDLEFFEKLRDFTGYEKKIFDLQKESFSNTRNLIIAAAAISSVDLLTLQSLEGLGLNIWFLLSVALLYISCVSFSIYLTSANNFQTKIITENYKFFEKTTDLMGNINEDIFKIEKDLKDYANSFANKLIKQIKFSKKNKSLHIIGSLSFILGLIIPIIGLIVYIIKTL